MGQIVPIFKRVVGMNTDAPQDDLPPGFVRWLQNFVPNPSISPLRRRNGWTYGSLALTGSNRVIGITGAPFSNWNIWVALTDVGDVWVSGAFAPNVGQKVGNVSNRAKPFWHRYSGAVRGGYVIFPGSYTGAAFPPQKYAGSGSVGDITALAGAPQGGTGASWGDYLILARDASGVAPTQLNRMWFSDVGNPESWNANGYLDMPSDITAVVPKGNLIFVFGSRGTHLITGDTPPPGGNLSVRKFVFPHGVASDRAVATYKDYVIWANAQGVWKSDGGQPINLTQLGGIQSFFRGRTAPSNTVLAVGVWQNYLFVSVSNSVSSTGVYTFICDLDDNAWGAWTNVPAFDFTVFPGDGSTSFTNNDLLFASYGEPRIGNISSAFVSQSNPGNAVQDANGTTHAAIIRTGALRFGSMGKKRIRRAFLSVQGDTTTPTYLLTSDGAEDSPGLGSLNPVIEGVVTPSDYYTPVRASIPINREVEQIEFQVWAGTGTVDVKIWGLDAEVTIKDRGRAGDVHG